MSLLRVCTQGNRSREIRPAVREVPGTLASGGHLNSTKWRDGQSHAFVHWPSLLDITLEARGRTEFANMRIIRYSPFAIRLLKLHDQRQEHLVRAACLARYFQGIAGRVNVHLPRGIHGSYLDGMGARR